ncbi:MAG: hypothetical protein STSR0008_12400 [Ignavibacterium sp.]
MEIEKQYIIQCISVAANNLRLSNEKIEIIAMLRDSINKANNLDLFLKDMKKVTEFSKLAIRLNDIYNYLNQTRLDFFKLSEKFKSHCQLIIKDLNLLLENTTIPKFKDAIKKLESFESGNQSEKNDFDKEYRESEITVKLEPISQRLTKTSNTFDINKIETDSKEYVKAENEVIKEKIILEDESDSNDDISYEDYERNIVNTIKELDIILKKITHGENQNNELNKYSSIMKDNANLSKHFGTEIVTNMHNIVSKALQLLMNQEIKSNKYVIEAIRACLIVIVALVRNKDVDITNYLNRAEEFGKQISLIN